MCLGRMRFLFCFVFLLASCPWSSVSENELLNDFLMHEVGEPSCVSHMHCKNDTSVENMLDQKENVKERAVA